MNHKLLDAWIQLYISHKNAMEKKVKIKVNDRVILITNRHGVCANNPVYGEWEKDTLGSVLKVVPNVDKIHVMWDNEEQNIYSDSDLLAIVDGKLPKKLPRNALKTRL